MDVSSKNNIGGRTRVRGFSLLEIMITVAIISIMTVVSIVSLSNMKQRQQVAGDARRLTAAVREVQSFALTGRNILGAGFVPCAFKVSASADGKSFALQQSNSNDCDNFQGSSYPLSGGVTFLSGKEIRFEVPQGEPLDENKKELGETGARSLVDFALTKGGSVSHVCIYPLGRVEENNTGC